MAAANEVSFREQLCAKRRVIRKAAGIDYQDDCEMLSIVVEKNASSSCSSTPYEEWLKIMRARGEPTKQIPPAHMIQKVPDMLRQKESSKDCFDPLVVSIGPYHHGKSELAEVERLKTPMAFQFVKDSGKLFDCIYDEVESISGNARKCYPEDSTNRFDEKEFARMMFLDGCFILQFMYSISKNKIEGMKSNIAVFVRRDLMLLENQLPYQVLKVLMKSRFKEREQGDKLIDQFINIIRGFRQESLIHQESFIKKTMRSFRKGQSELNKKENQDQTGRPETNKEENEHQPVHLLDLFRTRFIDKSALIISPTKIRPRDWYSYPAAKELRTLGIHFRPSREHRFTDIRFKQTFTAGKLFLPKLIIDDTTESLLLNLVAYESCPGGPDDCGVTSYICFMDSLIDQAEDVKVLRSKRIIYNILGSDQQAADLFNEVAKDLVPNPNAFIVVSDGIERHSTTKWKTWMAEWIHTHFSSPWTFIAFLAAIIALVLTFVQTYLSLIDYYSGKGKKN